MLVGWRSLVAIKGYWRYIVFMNVCATELSGNSDGINDFRNTVTEDLQLNLFIEIIVGCSFIRTGMYLENLYPKQASDSL